MPNSADGDESRDSLRDRLIGFGERSFRKSYYPELQNRLDQLERFRRLLDCTLDAILVVELPTDRIVDANASACRKTGYPREKLLSLNLAKILDLDHLAWPQHEDPAAKMISTILQCGDGSEIPVEINLSMADFGGSVYGIVVARDVSERLRAERALQKSEWEKALILESTEELILYLDPDMHIVWANHTASQALTAGRGQLIGCRCWEAHQRQNAPCLNCPVIAALETGRPQKGEVVEPDGRVWFVRGYPARNEAGEIEGVVELCLDVTERKKAEEALRQSDRMKSEFISTAAHELSTPLTAIQGFSQLLLTDETLPAEEQREFLSYIHHKAVALSRITEELLDIAHAETGSGPQVVKAPCTAGELTRQAELFLQAIAAEHRLIVEIAAGDSPLEADSAKIAEVFENLLGNAVKYSSPNSPIRFFGGVCGDDYQFGVTDQGIGMTQEQEERIFEKFYRADASDTAPGGLGLGMSLTRTIVEAHGGRIWVESRPDEGTTVRFTLPLAGGHKGEHCEKNSDCR
ncbi:MAG TPA: ATP-binding protein [Desulfuromonadales bacterium]|nr:ATP-binding protein [Desulfuromonadales bacterium]